LPSAVNNVAAKFTLPGLLVYSLKYAAALAYCNAADYFLTCFTRIFPAISLQSPALFQANFSDQTNSFAAKVKLLLE
jgi:hypothetical protein